MKNILSLSLLLMMPSVFGADLYEADFSVAGQGATHDNGSDTLESSPITGENWSIFWDVDPATDSSTNSFITQSGVLFSDDWGGVASFETAEIDVSGVDSINIEAIASTRGDGNAFSANNEQFAWYYLLDGTRTDGPVFVDDGSLDYTEAGLDVAGISTLKVGFTFFINGRTDGFDIISVKVNDGVASPEMSLSANPTSISESGGFSVVTVTIPEAIGTDLVLDLSIGDTDEATIDATATITAGDTTGSFLVTAVGDEESDGPQVVNVTATDPNGIYKEAELLIIVEDDEAFTPPSLTLNEIRINATNAVAANGEYFEIVSNQANASLNRIFLVAIGAGTAAEGSGVVEEVVDLSGQTMNGNFFVAADTAQDLVENPDFTADLNFENDNVTFLLVSDFASVVGADLDTDDDSVLDVEPWGALLDGVSLTSEEIIEGSPLGSDQLIYAPSLSLPVVGPDINDNGVFIPAHVYRAGNIPSQWLIGTFYALDPDAKDTPGTVNSSGEGSVDAAPEILGITVDRDSQTGELIVTGLGSLIFQIEYTDEFSATTIWTELPGGFIESDNPDGTTTFSFNDPGMEATSKRFYRINVDLTP